MDITALAAPFPPDIVSWRVGPTNRDKTKGMALAYIDARDVQDRLTEVCGPFGWQCRHEVSGDKRVTCHIGIRDPETSEWIWRSDGAGETDHEAEKGSYSDSFKRAAVKWGIGRYLYDVVSPWVEIEQHGKSYSIKASELPKLRRVLGGKAGPVPDDDPAAAAIATWTKAQARGLFDELQTEIRTPGNPEDLKNWTAVNRHRIALLPEDWQASLREIYVQRLDLMKNLAASVAA